MVKQISSQDIYAGDTVTFNPVRFLDGVTPQDLSTWGSWVAHWRPALDSSVVIVLAVDASESNIGIIRVSATPAQTTEMAASGVWDLQATRDGVVRTWLRGRTNWSQDVSRP